MLSQLPDAWSGCDLIMGFFSSVPIKKGMVEAIGAATLVGKGKEKKIKQEAIKKAEVEGSVEGIKAGHETKNRKTVKSRKQLVIFEELEGVDPSTVGKEVSHPLIPKIKVKTKVESFFLQVPVGSFKGTSSVVLTSSAHGFLESLDIIPQSPLGLFGCTHSKQKTVEEFVERERERGARPHSFFSFLFLTFPYSLLVCCLVMSPSLFFFFYIDEWSFFLFVV